MTAVTFPELNCGKFATNAKIQVQVSAVIITAKADNKSERKKT